MFCILHYRELDSIKLDAFSSRSSEIQPPTPALLQTGRWAWGADGPWTRQLDSLRFFRRHLCPVTQTYCYVRGAIGRSGDFDRQVCRRRDHNKGEWRNRGEVKKKGWVLKIQSREQRSVFFMAWILFRFADTKSTCIDKLYARKTSAAYYIVTRGFPCQDTWRKLIVTFVF